MKKYLLIFFLAPALFFCSCTQKPEASPEDDIAASVDRFATSYFNFDLKTTRSHCTEESERWLAFLASNISQEDIDIMINSETGASHEIKEVNIINDTTAIVACEVFNFMKIDTIGKPGAIVPHASYNINVVKRGRKWLVKMEGLPQSEKRNRD